MPFCILPKHAEILKDAIRTGKLTPDNFGKLDSKSGRDFLAEMIGKDAAKEVNLLFEKKLLLKNQERAMYSWLSDITGMSKAAKEATAKKIADTLESKRDRIYSPEEGQRRLDEIINDVYSHKYDTEITPKQAQIITDLSADLKDAQAKVIDKTKVTPEGIEAGAKQVAFDNYVNSIKQKINERNLVNPFKQKGVIQKIEAVIEDSRIAFNFIADTSRALLAGVVDNSFWGNQGGAVLMNPKYVRLWRKNMVKSISDIFHTLGGGNKAGNAIIDASKALTYAEPNYLNGRYENKGGVRLDIWKGEEDIPTHIIENVPVIGRLAKAADVAYEVGAVRLRTDIANKMYDMYEKIGLDLKDKDVLSSINKEVNSMTGRGNIGQFERVSKPINAAFFSVRFLKSTWDTMTAHLFDKNMSPKVKADAAKNLLRILSTGAVIIGIANALKPGTVEMDPTSSDFTKVKVGNTRISIPMVTRMASLITLIERIRRQETKSSATGKIYKLGEGFGSKTGTDIFWDFTENKLSPLLTVIKHIVDQKTFTGEKPTIASEIGSLTVPMGASGTLDIMKDNENNILLKAIAAALQYFGANTQVYK